MGERLASSHFEFDQKQKDQLYAIGSHALELSAQRYGTGYPAFTPGEEANLLLNNARHNFMVGENGALLGGALGLSSDEQELVRAAGNVHDVVQLKGRNIDEEESAEWFVSEMARTQLFPAAAIEIGSRAVLGTKLFFDADGKILGQVAGHMKFRSVAEEKIIKSVASADYGEVRTPIGPYLGHLLMKQRRGLGPYDDLDMANFAVEQAKELAFVESFTYILPEAEKVFSTHRKEVTGYHQFLADIAERGEIQTWRQLEAMDLAFRADPSIGRERLLQIAARV